MHKEKKGGEQSANENHWAGVQGHERDGVTTKIKFREPPVVRLQNFPPSMINKKVGDSESTQLDESNHVRSSANFINRVLLGVYK